MGGLENDTGYVLDKTAQQLMSVKMKNRKL